MNDGGFLTLPALAVIFSLSVIALSLCMLTAANERLIGSYKNAVDERKKIDSVIYGMERKMQSLKDSPSDADAYEVISLLQQSCGYDLRVTDVSTGINRNFVSPDVLSNESVRNYIALSGDDAFIDYGWMNPSLAAGSVLEEAAKDFDGRGMFPLINGLAPFNVHFMSGDFLSAVLKLCGIRDAERKAEVVRENLSSDMTAGELAGVLEVSPGHPFLGLVGTKTSFWKVDFETDRAVASAVFAAVPERNDQRKIERYILVEKKITIKGGTS